MPRYKITIEYDGRPYNGWQVQTDKPSVQEEIARAASFFCGHHVDVVGAGRTDSGVHATAQVAHIDFEKEYEAFSVMQGINYYLFNPPEDAVIMPEKVVPENLIAVLSAERVSDEFHARFTATKRRYLYRIINRRPRLGLEAGKAWHVIEPLNVELMREAAKHLIGHHDFSSFRDTQCQSKSPEKTLEQLDITRYGNEVHIATSARSFLHHQVRIMTGTLALVGKGRWQPNDVKKALAAKTRSAAGLTAPPDGLYLTGVDF
ncbi:MAG: tRNA pseudouridine(38-40) synthase TruA [Alphaproteobacteria bacterium]|nr:tRNA pseudouridine(38-40) synthase TruA [Alphaproteobacteria bacterium]